MLSAVTSTCSIIRFTIFSCFPSNSYTSSCHIVHFPTSYINIPNSRVVTWMDLCIERVDLVHVWRLSCWGRGIVHSWESKLSGRVLLFYKCTHYSSIFHLCFTKANQLLWLWQLINYGADQFLTLIVYWLRNQKLSSNQPVHLQCEMQTIKTSFEDQSYKNYLK